MIRLPSRPLLLLILAACRTSAGEHAAPPPAASDDVRIEPQSYGYVELDTVRPRPERVVAVLPARLALDEDRTVRITSPVEGRIRTLLAAPGDIVARDQVLAEIASTDAATAASDLAKARAALEQADAALARAHDLYDHQVIARKELEQAIADQAQAAAERDRAQQRATLLGPMPAGDVYSLRAPFGGEVIERAANPGAEVRPDAPEPLFTLSDLDTLWLTASVYERDIPLIHRGDRMLLTTDAAPGRRLVATISYVSAALDPATRTAVIRAVLPNPGRVLRAEASGEASILVRDTSRQPAVPSEALVTRGDGSIVFVYAGPGHFVARPVTVLDDDGQFATIASGVTSGEIVAGRGALLLAGELSGAH